VGLKQQLEEEGETTAPHIGKYTPSSGFTTGIREQLKYLCWIAYIMGTRRCALRDVLTMEQYRELLREAARIENRVESISLFFFLVTMGRLGMRVGEVIHMRESWYKEDRGVISIAPHSNCDCGLCKNYAESYADNNDLDFEEVFESYWKVKDGSDRDVKVPTERDREIIELYFEEVPYTDVSYSTVNRRLKKIAEIVGEPEVHRMYPHMLRATAATHLAHSGFLPYALDVQFGWSDENTKTKYVRATGLLVEREYDRMWGESKKKIQTCESTHRRTVNSGLMTKANSGLLNRWLSTCLWTRTHGHVTKSRCFEAWMSSVAGKNPQRPIQSHRLSKHAWLTSGRWSRPHRTIPSRRRGLLPQVSGCCSGRHWPGLRGPTTVCSRE